MFALRLRNRGYASGTPGITRLPYYDMLSLRLVFALLAVSSLSLGAQAAPPPSKATPGPASGARAHLEPEIASYRSSRLNGKPLPVTDQVTDTMGVQYQIEFDELILAIRPNHEFRASLRYRQALAAKGARMGSDPVQKMTVYGTWVAANGTLRFTPDPKRGGSGLDILAGTFSGPKIEVPFDYRNGTVLHRANVVALKDPHIF